jgi:hypothetical protein
MEPQESFKTELTSPLLVFANSGSSVEQKNMDMCADAVNRMYSGFLSRDSLVGIAIGCGLEGQGFGVGVPVGARIFSSPRRPDRLWGPPSLLSNWYPGGGGLFQR